MATYLTGLNTKECIKLSRYLNYARQEANQAGQRSMYPYGYESFDLAAEFADLYWDAVNEIYNTTGKTEKQIQQRRKDNG